MSHRSQRHCSLFLSISVSYHHSLSLSYGKIILSFTIKRNFSWRLSCTCPLSDEKIHFYSQIAKNFCSKWVLDFLKNFFCIMERIQGFFFYSLLMWETKSINYWIWKWLWIIGIKPTWSSWQTGRIWSLESLPFDIYILISSPPLDCRHELWLALTNNMQQRWEDVCDHVIAQHKIVALVLQDSLTPLWLWGSQQPCGLAHGKALQLAARSWEQLLANDHQETEFFSITVTKNWILLTNSWVWKHFPPQMRT